MKELARIRKANRLTQSQLAEMAGVSQGTIAKVEGNRNYNFTAELLYQLAAALNVEPAELIGLPDPHARKIAAPPMKYRIKDLRKQKGWTLDQLAEVVGTSKGYLSDLERGKRTGGVQMLCDIAQALGISASEIFSPKSPEDEKALEYMESYMRLTPEDKQAVNRHIQALLSAPDLRDRSK